MLDREVLLAFGLLVGLIPLAGCAAPSGGDGVVVTSQPLADAFDRLEARDHVAGIPDWAIVDEPWNAERVGRPFVIEPETVTRLNASGVLDQPHPLVSGPSRKALETGVTSAGLTYTNLPTEPRMSTVRTVLETAANRSGTDAQPAWQSIREDLRELNATLEGEAEPKALFLFPAGLVAGNHTDVDEILDLAGMRNAAAIAGLEGYAQITDEAIRRTGVDLVIATATTHTTPEEIAGRPMFEGTQVEDQPENALVVDPSRTTRLGPYLPQAAHMLATWSHPTMPGPRLSPTLDPYQVQTCETTTVHTDAPNATVHMLGDEHAPGEVRVPDVPVGHYRVTVTAQDSTGEARMETTLSVEGSTCE